MLKEARKRLEFTYIKLVTQTRLEAPGGQGSSFSFLHISQSPLLLRSRVYQELEWLDLDKRLAFHSATNRPQLRMETDVTGTCRPVSFVFQCPLPFELFLPPTLLTKESLCLRRNKYPVTSCAGLPERGDLLNAAANARLSCDSEVSGENGWLNC